MLDMQRREAGDEVVAILIGLQGENPACIRRDDDQRMDPGSQHAFGEEVAKLVEEVTDDKSLPKDERKRLQIEEAPNKSDRAKILSSPTRSVISETSQRARRLIGRSSAG